MRGMAFGIAVALCAIAGFAEAEGKCAPRVWTLDPLEKVFPDTLPGRDAQSTAEVARGECASFQIAVRAEAELKNLRAEITPFSRGRNEESLTPKAPRFVGYVPVDRPTQTPSKDQLRKPPADYPDPLIEADSMDVPSGRTQAVWITVAVPETITPGKYRASLTLTAMLQDREVKMRKRLSVRVYPAAVGPQHLWVTDWFGMQWQHMKIAPEPESDAYYALLRRYARNMAEHRHNVALISPLSLATVGVDAAGKFTFDFSRFDRWVNIFKEEGVIGRIEGGHIGGRSGDWDSDFAVMAYQVKDGKAVSGSVAPSSPEADAFYAQFFPALVAHLQEKGWLDCYLQHLADEPINSNTESYRAMAKLIRTYAPGLRTVEACHTKELTGSIDVWVPQLNYLKADYAHYTERQKAGDEVWLYTCVFPQGEYANRFIELPLIKTRLIHWINYRYGVTGYLHWGYNQWTADSPFTHTTRPHGGPPYLPAGDAWIVYPGVDGPWDSIRFEAMRDGIADYELLRQLGEKDPEAAQKLATGHIIDFDKYNTDLKAFRATRHALLRQLSKAH